MGKFIDLTGQRFGRLVALRYIGMRQGHSIWESQCDCGSLTEVSSRRLRSSETKSCGCWRRDEIAERSRKHALADARKLPEYRSWTHLRQRCGNPDAPAFENYGGRGIKVCDRWLAGVNGKSGFECFLDDMGPRPSEQHSIDRIDNDGDYEPQNCRWATRTEQVNNRRSTRRVTIANEQVTLSDAASRLGIPIERLRARWRLGLSDDEIVAPGYLRDLPIGRKRG